MYTVYFGLSHKPFKPKDPSHFYRNANFDAVCVGMLDSIRERCGVILLTGEPGVGKTHVLRRCIAEAEAIHFVMPTGANLTFVDCIKQLCSSLELATDGLDSDQQASLLQDTIATHVRENRIITLVIDDADNVQTETLLHLVEFVEQTLAPADRLQIVLVGLPEIEGRLRRPELRVVQEQIQARYQLDRLKPAEIGGFITQQLEVAGYRGEGLLSADAVARVEHYCQGIPQSIAILCDTLLLLASLESERNITPKLVDEAAQSCFLGDQQSPDPISIASTGSPLQIANAGNDIDTGLDLASLGMDQELDFSAELDPTSDVLLPTMELGEAAPESKSLETVLDTDADAAGEVYLANLPLSPTLLEFAQLMDMALSGGQDGDNRNLAMFQYFRRRYMRLLRGGDPARLAGLEQRITCLSRAEQFVYLDLVIAVRKSAMPTGTLCALVVNPTWWQYRELRLQVRCPDLVFDNEGNFRVLRLLDGRRAQPVYVNYHAPSKDFLPTTLQIRLELCNHRGEWSAYNGWVEIRSDFRDSEDPKATTTENKENGLQLDYFQAMSLAEPMVSAVGVWLLSSDESENVRPADVDNLGYTLPLELEYDSDYSGPQASTESTAQVQLSRGSLLTRALLLVDNPSYAPARIELVSRPFVVFGRYNTETNKGFGDFALGFIKDYTRISRLHCLVCALGDQLALMPTSDLGYTYTSCNDERLEQGSWRILEDGDVLSICDLYQLKLTVCRDHKWQPETLDWDIQKPRDKFGHYLMDLVDVLRKVNHKEGGNELQIAFRNRYLKLKAMQERVTQLSGVGNPGSLQYVRFEREDEARRKIAHYYLPKWLSLGSDADAGLRITAPNVELRHAELFFRDGMYWIQNLAAVGAVQIGCHSLATNEVLALEADDELSIGEARFVFKKY
ncbi:MAG: hypothetical protein CSA09_03845 [Candidatus Contendobacter odensis]|uniref:AAA+ ATPase domain-containing protein n=1 Tax=Candidatus Contendibacter odensensis TaxID=1400860 RepID=A0A2G6PEN5_9GAMM|nr:MAG: hypothetical protein CSA09_03845 [Candidatus Contendobacter odensis]